LARDPFAIGGAQLDLAHFVHRTWIVEGSNTASNFPPSTFLSNLDATLPFLPTDVSAGSDPLQFEARHWGVGPPEWRAPAIGTRTATSIDVLGLSPTNLREYLAYAVGQPITPSLSVVNAAENEGNGAAQGDARGQAAMLPASADIDRSAFQADGEILRASILRGETPAQRDAHPMQAQAAGSLTFRVRLSQAAVV